MGSYTDIFGGNALQPADPSFAAYTFAASLTMVWPTEQQVGGDNYMADILELNASGGALSVDFPDARQTAKGTTVVVSNIGANTFSVRDNAPNPICAPASGEVWVIWLADNSTAAGTWRAFQLGIGTSTASAASLVGYGIKAITTTLNQEYTVQTKTTDYTLVAADRAKLTVLTSGTKVFDFTAAATLGSGWFTLVRNSGTGVLTLDPDSGSGELINGAASITLKQGESAIVICDGTNYYTVSFLSTPASDTVAGVIEIATDAEALAGALTNRAIVPTNLEEVFGVPKYKTADEARNTTTTFANDADLSGLPIVSGNHYLFEGVLYFNVANSTMGFKVNFTCPSVTMQILQIGVSYMTGLAGVAQGFAGRNLSTSNIQFNDTPGASGEVAVHFKLYILANNTTDDILNVEWAQQVSDAGDLTLRKGSHIIRRWLG